MDRPTRVSPCGEGPHVANGCPRLPVHPCPDPFAVNLLVMSGKLQPSATRRHLLMSTHIGAMGVLPTGAFAGQPYASRADRVNLRATSANILIAAIEASTVCVARLLLLLLLQGLKTYTDNGAFIGRRF